MLEVMAEHTVLTVDELCRQLAEQGVVVDSDTLLDEAKMRAELYVSIDGGVVSYVPTLAEGVVLTHRVSQAELEAGMLGVDLDLAWYEEVAFAGLPLRDGGWLTVGSEGLPDLGGERLIALLGPEGLAGRRGGQRPGGAAVRRGRGGAGAGLGGGRRIRHDAGVA